MKHSWKHILALLLAVVMLFALACPGIAAGDGEEGSGPSVTWEKIDASPRGLGVEPVELADEDPYGPDDEVRVSIVLEDAPALQAGFSKRNIGTNASVQSYRDAIRSTQDVMASKISVEVLGGQQLDVVWNLTLAANLISARVPYGKIDAIKAVPGVKDVIIEMQYNPSESVNMSNASEMVGTTQVWASEYTGAGSIVAIIDTGIDTAHELFAADGFDYAIAEVQESSKEVDLLTRSEVSSAWRYLNAKGFSGVTATKAYVSTKIPFAVNYVDGNVDITHQNDSQGEHGSHVAGIAAANRYVKRNGEFVPALTEVFTQGEAPDAQILVMKVFGRNGGAYDSDYMAAIEDAITLGADAVNLSLGSAVAGYVMSDGYQDIMEGLAETDTVVAMSAGNSYDWAHFAAIPYIYSDGANLDTVGSPGSFTNSLSVASVNNDGATGMYISAYDSVIFYNENTEYGNAPISSVAGEQEFVFIFGAGVYTDDDDEVVEDDFALLAEEMDLEGKVLICNRGASYFYQKANAGAAAGASAVIIANNQSGVIGLDLTGYEYNTPVVSITQADAAKLIANTELVSTGLEDDVYVGTLTIESAVNTIAYGEKNYTMSDFSSWGVPGDLSLKPEITAPGGNIWSVNGMDHTYENMSGTSMASPQIAGITCLMAQYIRENGLEEISGLSQRQLINSLLMSTATPLIEADSGFYYSVMKQGAGLVNADAATNSDSFILMDDGATASAGDGKVKVELGDDPDRTGEYSFSFTINNLTEDVLKYDVRGDFFTQDIFGSAYGDLLDTWTIPLDADFEWYVDEEAITSDLDFNGDNQYDDDDAQALLEYVVNGVEPYSLDGADFDGDGEITTYDAYQALLYVGGATIGVPAYGSVTVDVTVKLNDIDDYDDNGAYVEGYVFATERATEEGVLGTEHSIPVIGYYGGWNEPSMTDVGSRLEYLYGEEDRIPYMYAALGSKAFTTETYTVRYGWDNANYPLGGNPVVLDDEYMPERESISTDSTLVGVNYSLVRNSAGGILLLIVNDELLDGANTSGDYAAYYDQQDEEWGFTNYTTRIGLNMGYFEDGDVVDIVYAMAPEYYLDDEGDIDWDAAGIDDAIEWIGVVDGVAPEITDVSVNGEDSVESVSVEIEENRYVAGILVWNEDGWNNGGDPILVFAADPEETEGAGRAVTIANGTGEGEIDFSDEANAHLMIQVYDYAANYASYKLNVSGGETGNVPTAINVTPAYTETIPGATVRLTASAEPWGADESVVWRSSDERVAAVDENGVVTAGVEGTATITATSTLDPDVSGEATIKVSYPDIDLMAAIWDERSEVHFASFNTADMLRGSDKYKTLADSRVYVLDIAKSLDGRTYYLSDMNAALYTFDPTTFETRQIGTNSNASYLDVGLAPTMVFSQLLGSSRSDLLTIYGSYLIAMDTTAGTWSWSGNALNALDIAGEFDGEDLIGIAHIESDNVQNADILYYDDYFLIDNESNIYFFEMFYLTTDLGDMEAGLYLDIKKLGSFNDSVGSHWYFNSLYFDGENLFWSRCDFATYDDIYMAQVTGTDSDGYPTLGNYIHVGCFAEDVWPAAGLYQTEKTKDDGSSFGAVTLEQFRARADSLVSAKFAETFEAKSVDTAESRAVTGSLNAATVAPVGTKSVTVDPAEPTVAPDYTVTVTADEDNHNGLVSVEYDPAELELVSAESAIDVYAINDSEDGKVTIGYASRDYVYAGDDVLYLNFRMLADAPSEIEVTTEQLDDDFEAQEPETYLVGEYEYDGPEWIFSADYSSAVAVFTAKADPTIVESVDADVSFVTIPADYFKPGKTTYTYTVEFKGVTYTTTVVVVIPALTPDPPTPPAPDPEEEIGDEGTPLGDDIPFPFEDVYEDDWYYDAVYEMYKAGYIKGTSETTYEPNEDISRAQIVTILYRIDGENKVESGEPFTDVEEGAWYFDSVCWAYAKGIVKGISETEFDPDTAVTREQFAAIIYRYAQFRGDAVRPTGVTLDGYSDGGSVSDWAEEAMVWCVANKLIQGTGENALDPQSNATRGQAAVIFSRMIKLFE